MEKGTASQHQESNGIDSVSSSFETTSNPPDSHVSFSQFGDSDCGEPMVAQHLVLDFTPGEADNEFVQRKCCAFWDYISSRKDVHNMMASPDSDAFTNTSIDETKDQPVSDLILKPIEEKQSTAVSMLEFVEEKGLIDRMFEAKMKQSHCSLGCREYHDCEPTKLKAKKKTICTCTSVCTTCRNVPKLRDPKARPLASAQFKTLNQKLQAWDANHPKSMEPPGHPPTLIHSVMQRKVE